MRVGLVRTRLLVGAAMAIAMTVHGVAHAELADEAEQVSPADADDTGEIVVTAE